MSPFLKAVAYSGKRIRKKAPRCGRSSPELPFRGRAYKSAAAPKTLKQAEHGKVALDICERGKLRPETGTLSG
jgi:hypothetical protein